MFKLFKDCFKITNDSIIIIAPLIIFLSIISWYINYAIISVDDVYKIVFAVFTLFVMACGFLASWLYMAKKTVSLSKKVYLFDNERAKDLRELILSLPKGVGKLFLPILGMVAIYILIYYTLIIISNYFITKYVGFLDFSAFDISFLTPSSKTLIDEITEIDIHVLKICTVWYLVIFASINIISFMTLLWIPEIVYNDKNSFRALLVSVANVFSNFREIFLLYLTIFIVINILSILCAFLLFIPIMYFLVLVLVYYFLVYFVVLLFTYYERKFKDE